MPVAFKDRKKMVNQKVRQVSNMDGPFKALPYALIKRTVKDIGTQYEDNDFWFDGRLETWAGYADIDPAYVIRLLREYDLIAN